MFLLLDVCNFVCVLSGFGIRPMPHLQQSPVHLRKAYSVSNSSLNYFLKLSYQITVLFHWKNKTVTGTELMNPYSLSNGSEGKECTSIAGGPGDKVLIPGLGRSPAGGKWQPSPVFLPEKSHGQRSLAGYSPWGHKKSDITEDAYVK